MRTPKIKESTKEERENYIRQKFRCKSDCESCGICRVFRGRDPELVYQDYINGEKSFLEISAEYFHRS